MSYSLAQAASGSKRRPMDGQDLQIGQILVSIAVAGPRSLQEYKFPGKSSWKGCSPGHLLVLRFCCTSVSVPLLQIQAGLVWCLMQITGLLTNG